MTTETVAEQMVVLCVGDTTFLDYGSIVAKREGYGPIGNGGNGLILHNAESVDPQLGQPLGLLWQKLWNRDPKHKPPKDDTPTDKKKRLAVAPKVARKRPLLYLTANTRTAYISALQKNLGKLRIFQSRIRANLAHYGILLFGELRIIQQKTT